MTVRALDDSDNVMLRALIICGGWTRMECQHGGGMWCLSHVHTGDYNVRRQSPKTATVVEFAVFGDNLSPNSATVAIRR